MKITARKMVTITYTHPDENAGSNETPTLYETSYVHGMGQIIPGLEAALEGRTTGDSFRVIVAPSDAYGEVNPDLFEEVSLDQLQSVENLKKGLRLEVNSEEGKVVFTIEKIEGEKALINANHPLAGKPIDFDVTVKEVRDATPEEIIILKNAR
jgi:FKBP-type peptidyl-prolyl cis-trans isomerase SlyD